MNKDATEPEVKESETEQPKSQTVPTQKQEVSCPDCNATGLVDHELCTTCNGNGTVTK